MKLSLVQLTGLKGSARLPFLAPDAAQALKAVEKDTDGLIYLDLWRDGISSLLAKRVNQSSQLPSYSGHNWGFSVDLDVKTILNQKKINYEDLLFIMKRRGWICHRQDGDGTKLNAGHFNYFGDEAGRLLVKCTMDPMSWYNPAEKKIYELYGNQFMMSLAQVQLKLGELGFYKGLPSGNTDLYTREAVLAFQRAWDLTQNGYIDGTLCRVLTFITAEIDIK